MTSVYRFLLATGLALLLNACDDGDFSIGINPPDEQSVYAVANSCVTISPANGMALAIAGEGFEPVSAAGFTLVPAAADASRFLLRPSDLGQYLLYDETGAYLTGDGATLLRQAELARDIREVDGELVVTDRMQSEGEWRLEAAPGDKFRLLHLLSGNYMDADGGLSTVDAAADVELASADGCAEFPELSLDASGEVAVTAFEDGDVFGFVETHAHLFSDLAFGGGGAFHGAPFHPLGVEHALPDCELTHGAGGRRDFVGFAFNQGLGDLQDLLPLLLTGELGEDDHRTEGYPTFTDWPNAPASATHQMQYYKWIERAYLSGLRLLVQHATTNQVLCQLAVGLNLQPARMSCEDMVAVDRIIEATYDLERYVDALSGGPGEGWFRVVQSPEEAREQIHAGNLAVVLGIEVSDVFDCYLEPFGDFAPCSEQDVIDQLDEYYDRGVRAIFPVHKLDNAFSAGDGDRRLSQIGSFGHTGHFSNFVQCPDEVIRAAPGGFDKGGVPLAGLNMPREDYAEPPPIDMSGFDADPLGALFPHLALLTGGSLNGEYCQNHGLTELGEFLMVQMMQRGMIIEVDHLPRKGYQRAYEILQEFDYPAAGTHGRNNNGLLYELGGVSKAGFGRCRDPGATGTMDDGFQGRIALIDEKGGYPAEGFGFDLNGFAGAPGPRFGPDSGCASEQTDEGITYPFTSYAGDITLEQPVVGNRTLDFNTEGMVHLGLVAEVIEDVRRDGVSDEDLEPLFRSAEGYLRMWELAEARGAQLNP